MFLKDSNNHVAVVVAEAPEAIAIVSRIDSSSWDLHSLSRGSFEHTWQPWSPVHQPLNSPAPLPVDPVAALRQILTGPPGLPPAFGYGAVDALASRFPEGPFHLFDPVEGYVHRFAQLEDAHLVALRRRGKEDPAPILFGSETQLKSLHPSQLQAVAAALEAKAPAAKPSPNYIKELFEMAKKAKATQAKKVRNVQAKAKRADGPVAKVLALYAKASNPQDTAAMIEAAVKAGVNESTARTQLYKFRKEKGIKAVKAAKAAKPAKKKVKKDAVKESAAKAESKADAKKPAAKAAAKPKGKAKGKKPTEKADKVTSTTPPVESGEGAEAGGVPQNVVDAAADANGDERGPE